MAKCSRRFLMLLPAGAALLCASPAHAGMLGWMDSAFTFRKDQKEVTMPRRTTVPPRVVTQPYYPNDEHVAWSNFYTRTDLEPQDYLSSSASKVMRPRPTQAQEDAAGSAAQAAGGWPAIAEQAAENARAEAEAESNMMIGEPGDSQMMANSSSRVGRATRIGPAVEDWREYADARMTSRSGDYDYRTPVDYAKVEKSDITIGEPNPTAKAAPAASGGEAPYDGNDPRYLMQNGKGEVTKYKVQGGDTLSSISDQPAIYGNWKRWPLIYSANRAAIGKSPSNLKAQQKLDIPRNYTEEQAREAERRAGRR